MKKIKTSYLILLILFIVFFIGILLLISAYKIFFEWNGTYIEVTNVYNKKNICQVEDNYYYASEKGVYTYDKEEPIIQADEPYICSENDMLYVYSNNIISGYNQDLKIIEEFEVGDIKAFSIANDKVITFNSDKTLHIYRKNDMSEIALPQDKVWIYEKRMSCLEIGNMKIYEYESNLTNNDTANGVFVFENGERIFDYKTEYVDPVLYSNDEYAIISSLMMIYDFNKSQINIVSPYKYKINPVDFFNNNDIIIGVYSDTSSNPHEDKCEEYNFKRHRSDKIICFDVNKMKAEPIFNSKRKERVIFADNDYAVTFYNGKYITYSLADLKITEKQKATEIQKGNYYCFQTCGDYIFVFDEKTGKVINRIEIP